MKNRVCVIIIAFILAITSAACEPSEKPAESLTPEPTVQTTIAAIPTTPEPAETAPITIVTTEPVTPPAETTPITEVPETRATEKTYAVPEDASPMPDLDADNVFIIPTMEEILLEFKDIQVESDTVEEEIVRLMKRNVVCFDLYLTDWFTYGIDYQDFRDNGITPIYSDYFTSYSQIEQFMKSTYTNEAAKKRLDSGKFVDVDGKLYYGRYNEWPSNPYMNRSILEIVSISKDIVSCRYYINISEKNSPYYNNGVQQKEYMIKEFDLIKEDEKWKLPEVMFDNDLYYYNNYVFTDKAV